MTKKSDKLKELMYNADFLDKLNEANTEDEVLAIFADFGVEMNSEKLRLLIEEAQKAMASTGELTDDQLGKVTGGANSGRSIDYATVDWKFLAPHIR